ncbi:MAG: TRAP transporter substrate-binding protein DctP [Pseudolabrys sp.]|nr:TRAP transporter substrate-binding protein DctP [Pseudolabrys sp.]
MAVTVAAILPHGAWAQSEADVVKATKTAQEWADGKLKDYGSHPITYTGEPIALRLTSHLPEVAAQARFLKKAIVVLDKMSNGKLKMSVRFGGTVHKVTEGFEANRSGLTDMAACFTFLNSRAFPLTQALSLPGMFPNEAVQTLVAESLAQKYFRTEFERHQVYLNGITGNSNFNLFSNVPITTLEELKGLKVRSGTGISQQVFQALGAVPVNISSADFFSALQRGLLDSVFTSDAAARAFRINEASKHHTLTPINNLPLEWCMNKRTIDGLPADLKEVFYAWSRQLHQADSQLSFMLASAKARELFKKQGMQLHQIAPEEWKLWQAKFDPVIEQYIKDGEAKGLPTRALVADIRAAVKKYGAMSLDQLMIESIKAPVHGVSPEK